ncbi:MULTISPECIES: aldo/keto reductase [Paenibacillus]|uniref:L-glyceraldehyde 3-phosphate reductase n=1 Tax=Paenibacillus polymyxa (strain SC2) TaxID=886882 RepID=E3EJJ6_PAEPS|nr:MULTISPECIES: aldo/keto reductase [Paenibacillus]ADO56546.1 L-glyceraldehyde 3-phosphate reductase [Paenibacillus polymyxa SC2]WPQ59193.1 aldo/keto reductase [Paenibacillus polymyxa]CCC85255.1 aldo-keto reductase family 1 member C1 [Paenibacillus polymyxa M1]
MTYIAQENRYEQMKYRRIGRSGVRLPAISLGLWQNFGGDKPFEDSRAMILRAFDLGVSHFDLANNYGPPPGSAEETFGHVLKKDLAPYRDELFISTKAGYYMWPGPYGEWGSRKNLLASLDRSLQRMGLDYVDVFYHHRPDGDTPLEESMGALAHAVKTGKALYVGLSNYGPEETKQAAAILKNLGTPLLVHQPMYSMLNRWIENGLQDVLTEVGAGTVAFCPLGRGQLTGKYIDKLEAEFKTGLRTLKLEAISQERINKFRALEAIAKRRGQTLPQIALTWALREGGVDSVLIGASRVGQIEENVQAVHADPLSAADLQEIDQVMHNIGDVPW